MSLRHKASCVDPQFAAPKQNFSEAARARRLWDRPDGNDATGVSVSKEVGLGAITSPQIAQHKKAAQQHTKKVLHGDVSFAGSYAPLRCSPDSPAVLSLVLQQAMAVADLAQRNLLEYEEGCTLRSCGIDDRQGKSRRGVVQGSVDAATAERMLEPFHSHMQNVAKDSGDGASAAMLQAYAGGHNPIVLSLKNQPVEVIPDALSCLDKAPLEPYACAKDLKYYLITPPNTKAEAAQFVASTADTYRQCSLGKHSPAPGSLLFPDAPILPLPCAADTHPKEQRRLRNAPTNSSKSGGPPLLLQESLKRSLQKTESLHSGQNAVSGAIPNPSTTFAAMQKGSEEHAVAAVAAVPDEAVAHVNATKGHHAAPQLPLQRIPFKVPDCSDASACRLPSGDVTAATTAGEQPALQSKHQSNEGDKLAQSCADAGVPDWFRRSLCHVCYQLQRRLLLDGQNEFPRRSLRSLHSPAVVVYVVVPSDSVTDVSQSLLLCSQALAPCTFLGLEEAQQQYSVAHGNSQTADGLGEPLASDSVPDAPYAGPPGEILRGYKYGQAQRKVALGSTRPWPSILNSIDPCPTNVVLQAITPAMLRDVTTCSVRSTAFAVYNKVALAEQGGAFTQRHRDGPVVSAVGHSPTFHSAPHQADSNGGFERQSATRDSLRHRRCWVECCAAFPPFKLAQVGLEPAPVIEEGQKPQGWLEQFCKELEPPAEQGGAAGASGSSPPATKGQFLDSPAVLAGKGSARQIHRSGSFLSQPISPLSTSPLPFSDSESSESESLSGSRCRARVSLTPVQNSNASPTAAAGQVPPETLGNTAARQAGDSGRGAKAADSGAAIWKDQRVLHCTYTVGSAAHGRPLVTMAWADANGELLHHMTEELPLHLATDGGGGGQQEDFTLAWWCADRLIGATLDVMARSGELGLEHVCVTLVLAQDCEQWVWMHVPQLLSARLQGSAMLARQLKRITVLNVAIDDPVLICQPQIHCEGADKAGMHIVYPGLRPMFHGHMESRAMQAARLRRAGLGTAQPKAAQSTGGLAASDRGPAPDGLANGSKPASALLTAKAGTDFYNNGVSAPMSWSKSAEQPLATPGSPTRVLASSTAGGKSRPLNGTTNARASPSRHADVSPKPADAWSGACEGPSHDAAPAASPAAVTFGGVPGSTAVVEDSKSQPGKKDGEIARKLVDGLASSSATRANGKISDYYPATVGAVGAIQASPAVQPRKRSREDGVKTADQRALHAVASQAAGAVGGGRPATASVLWLPNGSRTELGDGQGRNSPLRAMHVAILCQWSIGGTTDRGATAVRWVDPCSESVVAAARALHRLAFLHWCHWGFGMQTHRTVIWGRGGAGALPRVAHWPIHCALAARACRLAQQVVA